jgi:vitamin B12 transporter
MLFVTPLFYPAYAQDEEELQILQMFYKEEELVVTPTRYPKPISQTAENITVVTAEQIEAMNAHTLTDVLNTIPGVQVDIRKA